MKAHGKQPLFVITEQCAAMKQAIPIVFLVSKHRLCMWHITKKVPKKVNNIGRFIILYKLNVFY